ncbi:MAG: hypothetical protein ABI076_12255 [Acidobacteriaceae bacterium]
MRKLGNGPSAQEKSREVWGWRLLEQLGQDIRYTVRNLAKAPGFTTAALPSLMLGIGASVALFSVLYGVIISHFPYANTSNIWWPSTTANHDPMREFGRHVYTIS